MILLITGSTHKGKTVFAQQLLEKYHYPYLSVDHLKMELIRSGYCPLTPESSDAALTQYLWPVVREIIKTAIENYQDMVIEGCYIPFDYQADFSAEYLEEIQYLCILFSESYIRNHYRDIIKYACEIEHRINDNGISIEKMIEENDTNQRKCKEYGLEFALIDDKYEILWEPRIKT